MFPRLYAIMDASLLKASELAIAEMLAESGIELIQYRNKQASPRRLFETSRNLVNQLHPRNVRVIVNDRADVAALAGAAGVHVGQEDLSVEEARAVCGRHCWVGISTHTLEQVRAAEKTSADYVAVGPIFPTTTKEKPEALVGPGFIREGRALTRKPLVGIGGITLERAEAVFRAGADSVAVGSDLLSAADPAARAREYLQLASRLAGEKS